MKIGFVTACDISTPNGYTTRVLQELGQMKRKGMAVSVLSFLHLKYWGNIRGILGYVGKVRDLGYRVFVAPVPPDNQIPALSRNIDRLCAGIIKWFSREEDVSILHAHATQAAYLSVLANTSARLDVVYDMHGASVAEQSDLWEPNSYPMKRLELRERTAVLGSRAIIAVSIALQQYWRQIFPEATANSYIVPCAVNAERFVFEPSERVRMRARWGVGNRTPVFVYLGSVAPYQKIEKTLQIFGETRSCFPDARMLILTSPGGIAEVKRIASKAHITEKDLLAYSVDHDQVPRYLSAADFGFLLRDDLLLNNVSSPTKFGEYLGCGVPVILSPTIHDAKRAVDQHHIGFIYDEDLDKLKSFIASVMEQRDEWATKTGKYAADCLSWAIYGDVLQEMYRKISGDPHTVQ